MNKTTRKNSKEDEQAGGIVSLFLMGAWAVLGTIWLPLGIASVVIYLLVDKYIRVRG